VDQGPDVVHRDAGLLLAVYSLLFQNLGCFLLILGREHLDGADVGVNTPSDEPAGPALSAGGAGVRGAIEGLSEDAGQRGLADARWPLEQVGVTEPLSGDAAPQYGCRPAVADDGPGDLPSVCFNLDLGGEVEEALTPLAFSWA